MDKLVYGSKPKLLDLFGGLLCFFCFFPFINLGLIDLGTDVQVYALLIAIAYLILYKQPLWEKKVLVQLFLLGVGTLMLLVSILLKNPLFTSFRSYYNYLSVAIIPVAIMTHMKKHDGISEKAIKLVIWIWCFVALVQMVYDRNFMGFLVSNFRTTSIRGVCSLASEPSFYGYMCFFFFLIAQKFQKNRALYSILIIIQIVFLAQSSVALLYLAVLGIFLLSRNLIKKRSLKSLCLVLLMIMAIPVVFYFMGHYMADSRIFRIINTALYDPASLMKDQSVMERFNDINVSITGFFDNFGLPAGYATDITFNGRIMSGYGALLYELGLAGLIYIFTIFGWCKKAYDGYIAMALTIVMFSAIQLGTPVFGFLIGYILYENVSYPK